WCTANSSTCVLRRREDHVGMSKAYSTSRVPFAFSGRSVFSHFLPPSVVRYIPRPLWLASPWADTTTRLGSFGSTTILLIFVVSSRPMCVHVLPASVDLYMPSPDDPPTESPVPRYTMLGSDGATRSEEHT